MAHADLIDALNACIDCLHAGGQLEDCLRAYPYYADSLRPMLEVGLSVQRANPNAAPGARARTRARVMQAVGQAAPPPRRLSARLQRFGLAAASLLIVVIVALLIQRIDRSPSGGVQVTALASMTPTPTETVTASPTATATATTSPTAAATATPFPTASPTVIPIRTATLTLIPTRQPLAPAATLQPCLFTVRSSSVNLRSGPGTGYGVVGYGYDGEVYPVLARHTSTQWFAISDSGERVWIAASVGELTGECSDLEMSNEPLLEGDTTGDSGDDGSGDDGGGTGSGDDGSGDDGSGDDDYGDTHDDDSSGSGSGDDGDSSGSGSVDDEPDDD